MCYWSLYPSSVGEITIACDKKGENLIGLWIKGQKYHANLCLKNAKENNDLYLIDKIKDWLNRYFEGDMPSINELQLAPDGSEFRQGVWKILCNIPYGEVITYGSIADRIAKDRNIARMSAQAVGGAVGHNPISIIIPCHRVIGANGNLTGYAGGIDIKKALLEHEGVNMANLYVPKKGTAL